MLQDQLRCGFLVNNNLTWNVNPAHFLFLEQ